MSTAEQVAALDATIEARNAAGDKLQELRHALRRTQDEVEAASDALTAAEVAHTEASVEAAIKQTASPDPMPLLTARQRHATLQDVETELDRRVDAAHAAVEAADKAHDLALRDLARALLPAAREEAARTAQAFAHAQARWLSLAERAAVACTGTYADAGGLQQALHAAFVWPEPGFSRDGAPRPMNERDLRALAND
jgi:hypothetical protein